MFFKVEFIEFSMTVPDYVAQSRQLARVQLYRESKSHRWCPRKVDHNPAEATSVPEPWPPSRNKNKQSRQSAMS